MMINSRAVRIERNRKEWYILRSTIINFPGMILDWDILNKLKYVIFDSSSIYLPLMLVKRIAARVLKSAEK